jgi:hypothetical protein
MRKQRSTALLGVLLVVSAGAGGALATAAPSAALPPLLSLSPIRLFPPTPAPAPAPPPASVAPAVPAPPPPPAPPAPPAVAKARPAPSGTSDTADKVAKLRRCESGGNYAARSRRYSGAYQFSAATWRSLGYSGMPHEAPPHVQDEAARRLLARSGWSQWPACARKMGLR